MLFRSEFVCKRERFRACEIADFPKSLRRCLRLRPSSTERLEDFVRLSYAPVIRQTISRFVNVVVFLSMDDDRRRGVGEMIRVCGVDADDAYVIEEVTA